MKKGSKMSEESRNKMRLSALSRPSNRIGKKHSAEVKARISAITRERTARGENHYAYKHGNAQRNLNDRRKPEYKEWRLKVFERDNYTCTKCGDATGGNLRAHHIKPFCDFPDLRFEVSNGKTLCHVCHELEHFKPDSIRNQQKVKRGQPLWY